MSSIKLNLFDRLMNMVSQYEFQQDEIIKEITNYNSNGRYYITNYGNVITLCHNKWKLRKPEIDKDGYLFVSLWYKNTRTNKGIHQLVAEAFVVNPAPNKEMIIHHKDFNRKNNKASNLVYVSPKEHRLIHDNHDKEIAERNRNLNANRTRDQIGC